MDNEQHIHKVVMVNSTKSKKTQADIKWDVRQRLTLLESTVFWNGGLRTNSLVKTFGISRVQASKDLSLYQQLCPDNLRYDKHKKCYLVTDQFTPAFMEGTAEEYLHLLNISQSAEDGPIVALVDQIPSVCIVEPVFRQLSAEILQKVVQAIQRAEELEIIYRTMSRLKTISHVLCPHALVSDGLHWYVRGYSYNHEEFRNFLLVRIMEANISRKSEIDASDDKAWLTEVTVKIGPHPGLPDRQKAIIESDYGMQNGVLCCPIRAAMAPFLLNAMHVGIDDTQLKSTSYSLVLLNRDELDRYLSS